MNEHSYDFQIKGNPDSSMGVLKELAMQKIREKMKVHQKNFVTEMDKKSDIMVDELLNEIKRLDGQHDGFIEIFQEYSIKKRQLKNGKLPEKEFVIRNSLLNDLFEVKHIRTIYNLFIVMLFILFFKTLLHDFLSNGTINLGLYPIKVSFARIHWAFYIWCGMQMTTLCFYLFYKYWAIGRAYLNINNHHEISKIWNNLCLFGFISYQLLFAYYVIVQVLEYDLPVACSFAVTLEMIRFLMKIHAFVRTNVPRNFNLRIDLKVADDDEIQKIEEYIFLPNFNTFLYFLFAPTLIYQDNYPRTKTIRWKNVFWNFIEVVGTIFYLSFLIEHYFMDVFSKFGIIKMPANQLIASIFNSMFPATIIFVCSFYCLLHAWMNGAAELCKFGDRLFYEDWWNSTSFDRYYRTWNIVVHDWLYMYIYKDFYDNIVKQNKTVATTVVFTVSAVVHEIVLTVSFRFFYPIMYVLFGGFGFGLMLLARKHKYVHQLGNILLMMSICVGNGIMFSLYFIEHYARVNCKNATTISEGGISNYIVPYSWKCN